MHPESRSEVPWRPTQRELAAASNKAVADVLAPELKVLFCGINPSLYSAAVGHHFARPGNRFWPTLHAAGFTERLFSPFEDRQLLKHGYGLTNIVARATASADELTAAELSAGVRRLERKVRRSQPAWVAFLGLSAYRTALGRSEAAPGPQPERIGACGIWLLPNPSGLNAHYQLADLVQLFVGLRHVAAHHPKVVQFPKPRLAPQLGHAHLPQPSIDGPFQAPHPAAQREPAAAQQQAIQKHQRPQK